MGVPKGGQNVPYRLIAETDARSVGDSHSSRGGATGGCGGYNVPLTFGTSRVQGVTGGGPMKMIFASTAVFIQYCTSD